MTDRPAAKREQLEELQRPGRRPRVKSIRGQDVVAALGQYRDLLQADVGVAAHVLKALVGDVLVKDRKVEQALRVDRNSSPPPKEGAHPARPAPAGASRDPRRFADVCQSAIGRPILRGLPVR